jgi:creatinine amidohydrolase
MAMGVIEKHSEHLPLGTDFLNGHRIACLAAEKEPAVVFPPFYLGQIYEARCFPGCITIKPTLLIELIQSVFDEIGRNGFRKIVLHNAHGGNWHLLDFLAQASLWEEKPYTVHVQTQWLTEKRKKKWNSLLETTEHGHACECETSITLACHPELVKLDKIPKRPAKARKRLKHLPPSLTGIHWYSNYPDHYAGDARPASAKKGRILLGLLVDTLAEFISAVKKDQTVARLNKEFFKRVKEINQSH